MEYELRGTGECNTETLEKLKELSDLLESDIESALVKAKEISKGMYDFLEKCIGSVLMSDYLYSLGFSGRKKLNVYAFLGSNYEEFIDLLLEALSPSVENLIMFCESENGQTRYFSLNVKTKVPILKKSDAPETLIYRKGLSDAISKNYSFKDNKVKQSNSNIQYGILINAIDEKGRNEELKTVTWSKMLKPAAVSLVVPVGSLGSSLFEYDYEPPMMGSNTRRVEDMIHNYGRYLSSWYAVDFPIKDFESLRNTIENSISVACYDQDADKLPFCFLGFFKCGVRGFEIGFKATQTLSAAFASRYEETAFAQDLISIVKNNSRLDVITQIINYEEKGIDEIEFIDAQVRDLHSRRVVKPMGNLLKECDCSMSTLKANNKLKKMGLMDVKVYGKKKYNVLTGSGLRYGINLKKPKTKEVTDVYFFEDTFVEFKEKVLDK